MADRESIDGTGNRHRGLIPNASRVGDLVCSSAIAGTEPGTHVLPEDLDAEIENVFRCIRDDVEAAGGTLAQVVKISFWLTEPAQQRAALNAAWQRHFDDPAARPARHIHALPDEGRGRVHAEFIAVVPRAVALP